MYHFKRTEIGNNTCVTNLNRSPVDFVFKQGGISADPHFKAYPHAWALPLEYGPDFYPDLRRADNGTAFSGTQGVIVKDLMNDHHNRHNIVFNGNVGMYKWMRNLPHPNALGGQVFTEDYFNH